LREAITLTYGFALRFVLLFAQRLIGFVQPMGGAARLSVLFFVIVSTSLFAQYNYLAQDKQQFPLQQLQQIQRHLPNIPNLPPVASILPTFSNGEHNNTLHSSSELPGFGNQAIVASRFTPLSVETSNAFADSSGNSIIFYPQQASNVPISVTAKTGTVRKHTSSDVYFLDGDCEIRQGNDVTVAPHAVVWVDHPKSDPSALREVTVYLESPDKNNPVVASIASYNGGGRIVDRKWLGTFRTSAVITPFVIELKQQPHEITPEIYNRAIAALHPKSAIQQVAVTQEQNRDPASENNTGLQLEGRRIGIHSRGDQPNSMQSVPDPSNANRSITVITNGVTITIESLGSNDDSSSQFLLGQVQDISTDYAVVWASNIGLLQRGDDNVQRNNDDFEVYLEGNIVYRDGDRTIYADKMYYDVKNKLGYIVGGEVISPIQSGNNLGLEGVARLKADVVRRQGDGTFEAENAMITTSLLGEPSYHLRSKSLTVNEKVTPILNPVTRMPVIDEDTGNARVDREMWLVAENNLIYAGRVPVFYWPWMATDLQDPVLYIKSAGYGSDDIFGNQYRTSWNPFQIFNIRKVPDGLSWGIDVDYFDKRGIGAGTDFGYNRETLFGIPGLTRGKIDFWGIYDTGKDVLTRNRRDLSFPDSYRYTLNWKHRQQLGNSPDSWMFNAQVGKTSDANFLEQYYYNSWMTEPNRTTSVELKKTEGTHSLGVKAEYALDTTVTNTNTLPRLDLYTVGRSWLHDTLTWHSHTRLMYAQYNVLAPPTDPTDADLFNYLDYEVSNGIHYPAGAAAISAEGEVLSTRHELDLPFSLGALKVVPYVLGDFSHWGKVRDGGSLDRLYGQTGVRVNLPFWNVNPNVSSKTFYVNGLSHKVDLDTEFMYGSADKHIDKLIMYDPLDDWSTDSVRRRFSGGVVPLQYDPRYYALRSGMGGNVASSIMDIADSLTMFRFGMTHRWQTKRGTSGHRNIVDWITLSTHFNYYPDESQNNGQALGLIDYNLRWHVGDRFLVFSSGLFDTGSDSQKMVRAGLQTQRPGRGSLMVAADWFDGIVSKTYISLDTSYVVNKKYSLSYSTAYDVNDGINTGHNIGLVRTGESFTLFVGANYNESLNTWSFGLNLAPNFLPSIANRTTGANSVNSVQR
jgi:lipopolysaccharide export system protein LptA